MGYYIQGPAKGKAKHLIDNEGAVEICVNAARHHANHPEEGFGVVVVVDNGPFEAAGFAYSPREFECFASPDDPRPKTWLKMPLVRARELSGCREGA